MAEEEEADLSVTWESSALGHENSNSNSVVNESAMWNLIAADSVSNLQAHHHTAS